MYINTFTTCCRYYDERNNDRKSNIDAALSVANAMFYVKCKAAYTLFLQFESANKIVQRKDMPYSAYPSIVQALRNSMNSCNHGFSSVFGTPCWNEIVTMIVCRFNMDGVAPINVHGKKGLLDKSALWAHMCDPFRTRDKGPLLTIQPSEEAALRDMVDFFVPGDDTNENVKAERAELTSDYKSFVAGSGKWSLMFRERSPEITPESVAAIKESEKLITFEDILVWVKNTGGMTQRLDFWSFGYAAISPLGRKVALHLAGISTVGSMRVECAIKYIKSKVMGDKDRNKLSVERQAVVTRAGLNLNLSMKEVFEQVQ